jgi:hypothetical protein
MKVLSALFSLFLAAILLADLPRLPKASVTLRVSDADTSQPIPNAKARITFTVPDGHGSTVDVQRAGLTDPQGEFNASEATLFYISAGAQKDGYYRTGISFDLHPTLDESYTPTLIPISLKSIGKPIPMYARKHARIELPIANQVVGLDLTAFDWLPPYGKGTTADLLFKLLEVPGAAPRQAKQLTITFSNRGDGIQAIEVDSKQGSELRLPRLAPETGYQREWSRDVGKTYTPKQNQNYFFRVRTVEDGDKLRSAMYGKMHGDIGIDTINSATALVFLTYYLNPDGTRNVEFDPAKNLFAELPVMEQIRDP